MLERFTNPRMKDQLARIAADGTQKLPIRIVPHLKAFAAAGKVATGATRPVAGWVLHLRGVGAPVNDAAASALVNEVRSGDLDSAVHAVLRFLQIDDEQIAATVLSQAQEMEAMRA